MADDQMEASWPLLELPAQCMSGPPEQTACQTFLQYSETPCQCALTAAQHKDYTPATIHKTSPQLPHYDVSMSGSPAGWTQQDYEEEEWSRGRVSSSTASNRDEARSDTGSQSGTSRKRKRPMAEESVGSEIHQLPKYGPDHVNPQDVLGEPAAGSGVGEGSGVGAGPRVRSELGVSAATGSGVESRDWPETADPDDVRRDIQTGFGQIHIDLTILQHFMQTGCEQLIEQVSTLINLLTKLLQQLPPSVLHCSNTPCQSTQQTLEN
ncbi:uncharacterized protein LOC144676787 [Cetorhinus maximus]